jgi:hypothetical protein
MPKPHAYLTTTPWTLFTIRERKRPVPLKHCPSAKCQRAKACIDAHDLTYCQRTHESIAERRAKRGLKTAPAVSLKSKPWTYEEVMAKCEQSDIDLANAQARERELTKRWKAGEFDDLYGKFKPEGVWKQPPPRDFA